MHILRRLVSVIMNYGVLLVYPFSNKFFRWSDGYVAIRLAMPDSSAGLGVAQ